MTKDLRKLAMDVVRAILAEFEENERGFPVTALLDSIDNIKDNVMDYDPADVAPGTQMLCLFRPGETEDRRIGPSFAVPYDELRPLVAIELVQQFLATQITYEQMVRGREAEWN